MLYVQGRNISFIALFLMKGLYLHIFFPEYWQKTLKDEVSNYFPPSKHCMPMRSDFVVVVVLG